MDLAPHRLELHRLELHSVTFDCVGDPYELGLF
jgi:hypothetical protein